MSLASIQVTQPGASIALQPDQSGDLSNVDAGGGRINLLHIAAVLTGGVIASECTFTLQVRDCPDTTTKVLTNTSPGVWTLAMASGLYGPLAIKLTVVRFGITDRITKRYNFLSPSHGLALPANAEVVDGSTAIDNFGAAVNRLAWFSTSTSLEPRPFADFYRAIVAKLEALVPASIAASRVVGKGPSGAVRDVPLHSSLEIDAGTGALQVRPAVASMAALVARPTGTPDQAVVMLGYYAPGDGGGGHFSWSETPAIDDRGTIINPSAPSGADPSHGVFVAPAAAAGWRRVRASKELNVKWFGAKGDGTTDDTHAIQTALKAVTFETTEIYFPYGHYKITSTLFLSAQPDVVINPTNGIRLRGEASTNIGYPVSLNWYGAANGTLLNVTGYGHTISNLRFLNDVTGGFGSAVIAANGVALGSLVGSSDSLTSDIRFDKCRFQGFTHGVAFDPDSQINHNIEQCVFTDCWFDAFDTGLWIHGGQPFNTRVERCVFDHNDPTGANRSPYGCGIRIGGSSLSGGSLWIASTNFTYITYGIKAEATFQIALRDVDSENTKRLFQTEKTLGDSTFTIEGGRFDTSAVLHQRTGYMPQPADQIVDTDISYIKLRGGSISVRGCTFAPDIAESANFQIEMDDSCNIESANNIFPNLRPFARTGANITDGTKRYIGRTFSRCDTGVHDNPLFAPGGYSYSSCPTLLGAENGGGVVTISDANTFADVTLDRTEILVTIADSTSAAYDVSMSLEKVTGSPTISIPYVSAKTTTSFRINLSAAPGAGASLKVHYKISRGPLA